MIRDQMNFQEIPMQVTVVVDAFRAFTTASYILDKEPASYVLTTKSEAIARLTSQVTKPFFIGKSELGVNLFSYDIPNSPTRVSESDIKGKHVFHRTAAGARGVLNAKGADLILAAAFTNADATAQTILGLNNPKVSIIPMGHEGITPSLEDTVCAKYIESLIGGAKVDLDPYISDIKKGPGQYFFSEDQWQYPTEDLSLCLELNRVNFSIQADVKDDYAILTKYSPSL